MYPDMPASYKIPKAAQYQQVLARWRHCRINKVKLKPGHRLTSQTERSLVHTLWLRDPGNAIERLR